MAEISFPFRIDDSGAIATSDDINLLARDHVRTVVGTYPGERVMRPTYGLPTRDFLFENSNNASRAELLDRMSTALTEAVPEITFRTIEVTADPTDASTVLMAVSYDVRSSAPGSINQQITAVVAQ